MFPGTLLLSEFGQSFVFVVGVTLLYAALAISDRRRARRAFYPESDMRMAHCPNCGGVAIKLTGTTSYGCESARCAMIFELDQVPR